MAWLFKAVRIRHDCVHRAGYRKAGDRVDVSHEVINSFMKDAETLVNKIEFQVHALKRRLYEYWDAPF